MTVNILIENLLSQLFKLFKRRIKLTIIKIVFLTLLIIFSSITMVKYGKYIY